MWEQYKKTAAFTQIFIVMVCATLYFMAKMPVAGVALVFVVMQVGGLLGAAWGARLRRKMGGDYRLPLQK